MTKRPPEISNENVPEDRIPFCILLNNWINNKFLQSIIAFSVDAGTGCETTFQHKFTSHDWKTVLVERNMPMRYGDDYKRKFSVGVLLLAKTAE